jgi:alkylation response protein AidB-like acyl-CoA dehydrogenase
MDFNDTPDEAAFRREARRWLEENASLRAPGQRAFNLADQRGDPNRVERAQDWQARKADAHWACITWPKEYGGRDASPIQSVIWSQEEARFAVPPNLFTIGQGMLGPTIMAHGSEGQKQRYLEPMLRGEEIWCQMFSEPGAGSDLAGLRTRAERDPATGEWVVDGQKIWTSGAHYSRFGMIVTRTDPEAAKHAGITYFIVDMESPGVEIRSIKQINGALNFSEVFFDQVRIRDENRVGEVNDGWRGAITTLMNERATIGGSGAGGPSHDDLLQLAGRIRLPGGSALEDAAVRHRIADFFTRTKALQYTGYRTLTSLSRGETPGPQSSLGKLVGAAMRQQMAAFAIELQALSGALLDRDQSESEAAWQNAYLGSPGARLAGGTDEILRNIISERVLGMPAEARADKGLAFRDIPAGPPGNH